MKSSRLQIIRSQILMKMKKEEKVIIYFLFLKKKKKMMKIIMAQEVKEFNVNNNELY